MKMLNDYFTPIDVVDRLYFGLKNPYRISSHFVELEGEEKEFGKLIFNFIDEKLEYSIYIKNRQDILDIVELTLLNYDKYVVDLLEIY